jgi:SynChlorMet cassette protein ScmC
MKWQVLSYEKRVRCLALADGSAWGIVAGDETASAICSRLAEAMQLHLYHAPAYRLFVLTDNSGVYSDTASVGRESQPQGYVPWTFLLSDNDHTVTCIVPPTQNSDILMNQLLQLSLVMVRQTQAQGGFLLHGALAERDGWGVILAGPGRVGKTTASRRLPSSWRSLSDDATLLVRDKRGAYWAHPWPTWSSFMSDGPGGTWDVEHAVPLKAIFFLEQAQQDRVEAVAPGQSVCLLVELAEHTSWFMAHGQERDVARKLRLQRFENICSLVQSTASYRLHLSLNGAFWELIERVVNEEQYE